MRRLVFSVVAHPSLNGQGLGIAIREPGRVNRTTVGLGFDTGAPQFAALRGAPGKDAVRQAGQLLFDALMAHEQIGPELTSALRIQPPERRPVFVDLNATVAERLPWEALCSAEGNFLALDERWAMGRIVDPISPVRGMLLFEPPLRVAAVLSCLGVPAAAEWAALRAAREATDLPVEMLVLTSEESLYEEIRGAPPAGVTVEYVPSTVHDLAARLHQFDAHVLHLFCHGVSTDTSPHLQIAVRSDWLSGHDSRLLVEARDIRAFNPSVEGLPWLVVLNSCETASTTGTDSEQSVALTLIHEYGVHAAIGMREPVRSDHATLFTQAFYQQLFPELDRILGSTALSEEIDWPRLVVAARAQLADRYEPLAAQLGTRKEWTLPVVYTRYDPFEVHVPTTPPPEPDPQQPSTPAGEPESQRSLVLSIDALTGLRAHVEDSGDDQLLADIDGELGGLVARLEGR